MILLLLSFTTFDSADIKSYFFRISVVFLTEPRIYHNIV